MTKPDMLARVGDLRGVLGPVANVAPAPASPIVGDAKAVEAAIKAFQQAAGLEVDGVFGPMTSAAYARAIGA